jgi:hypothetical protein
MVREEANHPSFFVVGLRIYDILGSPGKVCPKILHRRIHNALTAFL